MRMKLYLRSRNLHEEGKPAELLTKRGHSFGNPLTLVDRKKTFAIKTEDMPHRAR